MLNKFYSTLIKIKKCPKTDAEILSLCTLCLCGSFLRIIYFLEVSYMNLHSWYFDLSLFTFGRHKKDKIKRMFEKWYPVIFITLLPPLSPYEGKQEKSSSLPFHRPRCTHKLSNHHYSSNYPSLTLPFARGGN